MTDNEATATLHLPVESSLKNEIARMARSDERSITKMARILLREALEARRQNAERDQDTRSPAAA